VSETTLELYPETDAAALTVAYLYAALTEDEGLTAQLDNLPRNHPTDKPSFDSLIFDPERQDELGFGLLATLARGGGKAGTVERLDEVLRQMGLAPVRLVCCREQRKKAGVA
jgi:hypothetical protein